MILVHTHPKKILGCERDG